LQSAFDATTDSLVFIQLASVLASIGGEDVMRYFARVLNNSNVSVRVVAAQALGALGKRIPPARIALTLLGALQNSETTVRGAAIQSLGQLGFDSAEIAQALHALRANDADLGVRTTATSVLLKLGHASDLNLIKIPAGEFLMGSDERSEEQPPHQVYLDEYFIGRYPVTNAEFSKFVQAGGYGDARFWELAIQDGWWKDGKFKGRYDQVPRDRPYQFSAPFNLPNHPAVGITWYEATAYAMWAGMRLPTEAEWEKAARGTDGRRYPWGNTFDATRCNSAESRTAQNWLARVPLLSRFVRAEGATTPIGQFSPRGDSPYGVTDMAGNVWEWCADWFGENYYKNSPTQNPKGSDSGEYRVLRGCAFVVVSVDVRAASRGRNLPVVGFHGIGFRVVASLL
jgi:formylglycine-generating enzyme required for sulfatase activity